MNGNEHALDLFANGAIAHQQHRFASEFLLHHGRIMRSRIAGDGGIVRARLEPPFPSRRIAAHRGTAENTSTWSGSRTSVHSAVEILCAPCALQMVTCGPIAPGIHSVPAMSDSTSFTPRRCGTMRWARVGYGSGIHTSISTSWSRCSRQGDQFDFLRETGKEFRSNCCWISNS